MTIKIAGSRTAMATYYGSRGAHIGATTGAPGSTATPANELATGGYARVATTWGSASDNGTAASILGSAVVLTVPASTVTHAILASAVSGANMIDWADITDTVFNQAGQLVLTPSYAQT